jgi:hypothetical protein
MRREVGRRRGGADADVGEVRVLDQRVSLGHVRREHHGLHVLDVKLRHDDVGHRVRDLHVAGEALDLVVQELAVVLGPLMLPSRFAARVRNPTLRTTCGSSW